MQSSVGILIRDHLPFDVLMFDVTFRPLFQDLYFLNPGSNHFLLIRELRELKNSFVGLKY